MDAHAPVPADPHDGQDMQVRPRRRSWSPHMKGFGEIMHLAVAQVARRKGGTLPVKRLLNMSR